MIQCFIRFKDAWGAGLIEGLQYPALIPGILPIGTGISIPSQHQDCFLFDIKSYYYTYLEHTMELVVYVEDVEYEGYIFDKEDIEGLLLKGWQYIHAVHNT